MSHQPDEGAECRGCRFWQAKPYHGGLPTRGHCHRFPPVIVMQIGEEGRPWPHHYFPQTLATAWCGEFQPPDQDGTNR